MDKIEKWLLDLVKEFRKILDKEEFSEYRESFRAFSRDVTYVYIQLAEYYYDDVLESYEIRIYKDNYGDNVELGFKIKLKSTSVTDLNEKARIDWLNDATINNSYMVPIEIDEAGNVIDFDFFYPLQIISLPKDFLKLNLTNVVKENIEKEILWSLRNLKKRINVRKSKNRLSLIDKKTLNDIITFLNADWTKMTDDQKVPYFDKIFFYLGFETIPLEIIKNYEKFNFLNNISHPEIIVYDLNSNFILLLEELKKIERKYLYKKDVINTIIEKFHSFLPTINRNINYTIIVNQPVTIDLDDYKFKHRILEKNDFTNELLKVFKQEILKIKFSENREISSNIRECINYIKSNS